VPEIGGSKILLEIAPTDGAEEVTKVNQDEREKDIREASAFDGKPKLLATKIAEIEEMAGAVEEEGNQRSGQT
jgi:hypothetical protein